MTFLAPKVTIFFNFHKLSAVSLLCKYQVERVTFVSFSTTKGSTSPHNTENKGRRIGLRIFVNYFLKNLVFLKHKGFLREEYINSFYDKFCHWLQKGVFSIQDWSNLVRKCLKMKVRLVILLTPKSIISYFKLFHFGVKISEKFLLLVTSEVSHYAI